mgnify:CR=1 FL=1|jgi:hypothetical protein
MKKVKNDVGEYQFTSNGKGHELAVLEKRKRDRTERTLFYLLLAALILQLVMLIYMINEWLVVKSSSEEFLSTHYDFGADQPFYRENPENYLRFTLRFMIIYGLISIFGITAIILRKPWLYLLIIVMALISAMYFFLL